MQPRQIRECLKDSPLNQITYIILKTKNKFCSDRALWVTIVNNREEIKLNRLIRWPIKTVSKMGTKFHGITKDEMKFGDSLNFIRYQVYNLCKEADVILTSLPKVILIHYVI